MLEMELRPSEVDRIFYTDDNGEMATIDLPTKDDTAEVVFKDKNG